MRLMDEGNNVTTGGGGGGVGGKGGVTIHVKIREESPVLRRTIVNSN